MKQTMQTKVIDLTPYLLRTQPTAKNIPPQRNTPLLDLAHNLLALWTQYLSLAALLLYILLRLTTCPHVPVGAYSGPLAMLWPVSYILLLTSYVADKLLWREAEKPFS